MTSYRKYLRIASIQLIDKRKKCSHKKHDEIIFYKRCLDCGNLCPFRNYQDVILKGEIPKVDDQRDLHNNDILHIKEEIL